MIAISETAATAAARLRSDMGIPLRSVL
jgi:hypothetical protein